MLPASPPQLRVGCPLDGMESPATTTVNKLSELEKVVSRFVGESRAMAGTGLLLAEAGRPSEHEKCLALLGFAAQRAFPAVVAVLRGKDPERSQAIGGGLDP